MKSHKDYECKRQLKLPVQQEHKIKGVNYTIYRLVGAQKTKATFRKRKY